MRFNQSQYAQYYHKQMIDGGYPGRLLPFVINELEGLFTVMDVGSGTGLFAIPLAAAGHQVTAVEPSPEMIKVMEKNIPCEIKESIKIRNLPWESWCGEPHDAVISVHSLYPMSDLGKSIKLMNNAAMKKLIIIRESEKMRTLSGIVRERLGILSNRDINGEVIDNLDGLMVHWKKINVQEVRKHRIIDINKEVDSLLFQLKLGMDKRNKVIEVVKSVMENDNISDYFNMIYSDNVYIF